MTLDGSQVTSGFWAEQCNYTNIIILRVNILTISIVLLLNLILINSFIKHEPGVCYADESLPPCLTAFLPLSGLDLNSLPAPML